MQTSPVTSAYLSGSVIAVPPLARDENLKFVREENAKIVRYIESGGVTSFLYGGNANFYHISLSEYADVLEGLVDIAGDDSLMVPAIGPTYGFAMDQVSVLKDFDFPTVMVLPQDGVTTSAGVATGFRKMVESLGKPIVLYIKFDGFIEPSDAARLVDDGLVSFIKYATVREDPSEDAYLSELVEKVDPKVIVSGIGEQPAIVHLRQFGLNSFTSGCVCVRPALSREMLEALKKGDDARAEEIRVQFQVLEDQRNGIHPIRVLHEAVEAAGIATVGPQLPFLSGLSPDELSIVASATTSLLHS